MSKQRDPVFGVGSGDDSVDGHGHCPGEARFGDGVNSGHRTDKLKAPIGLCFAIGRLTDVGLRTGVARTTNRGQENDGRNDQLGDLHVDTGSHLTLELSGLRLRRSA